MVADMSETVTSFMEAYRLSDQAGMWNHIKIEVVDGEWQFTVYRIDEVCREPEKDQSHYQPNR